jgi:hypothetical protein
MMSNAIGEFLMLAFAIPDFSPQRGEEEHDRKEGDGSREAFACERNTFGSRPLNFVNLHRGEKDYFGSFLRSGDDFQMAAQML